MIKIILDDKEFGREDTVIGKIHYETELGDDITGYDVIDAFVRVMKVAEYHPETIKKALEAALQDFTENENKDLNETTE